MKYYKLFLSTPSNLGKDSHDVDSQANWGSAPLEKLQEKRGWPWCKCKGTSWG